MKPGESERRAAFGPTKGGKTWLLRQWARPYQRQIVLDATGEWAEGEEPGREVAYAESMQEFGAELARLARQGGRWRVVISTEAVDLAALVQLLAPVHRRGRSSFTRQVGGLALIFDEAYEVCSHDKARIVRPLWLRGRHNWLSILAASQRAADVGRMVTSQSELVAITQTSEPIDLAYWRSTLPAEYYPHLLELKRWTALLYERSERSAKIITTEGKVLGVLRPGLRE